MAAGSETGPRSRGYARVTAVMVSAGSAEHLRERCQSSEILSGLYRGLQGSGLTEILPTP